MDHLFALLELCKLNNFENVFVHAFLDGRDVSPTAAKNDIAELENKMAEIGVGKLATIAGRYYAMDRDKRWYRVEKAYKSIVLGEGNKSDNIIKTITDSYENKVTDEFLVPTIISENIQGLINDNDSILFFNFRLDRARELTRAIIDKDFDGFERRKVLKNITYNCMTQYAATIENVKIAFPPDVHKNTLGEVISKNNLSQLRIAETEKYENITFFFNSRN